MKYILLGLIPLTVSCKNEAPLKKQAIDTPKLKLNEPKPEPSITITPEMYRNCILLYENPYKLIIQGKEYKVSSEEDILNKLILEKQQVTKSVFYAIADGNVPFHHTVSVIDVLEKAGIDNYELVDKSPVQPELENIIDNSKEVDLNDSTYLHIEILEKGYQVMLLDEEVFCGDNTGIDRFIINNKSKIDNLKILLMGKKDASFKNVKPVLEVLKKHNYWGYKIITK